MNLRLIGAVGAVAAMVTAFPAAAYAAPGDPASTPSYPATEYCRIVANPGSLQAGGTTQISLVGTPNADTSLSVTSADASISGSAIQIAGKQTAMKKADANGNVSFAVTLAEPGDYILDASMVTGESCGLTVKVAAKDKVVEAAEDEEESTTGNASAAVLANTGATTLPYVGAAVVLLGAGAVAVVTTRRRRNS